MPDAAVAAPPAIRQAWFRGDVEGLRGVAIGLVVLYHYQLGRAKGGNTGVDVFFVISGFVITSMLLRERERSGTTSLRDFYARRIRRILPAATVTLVATLVATALLIPSDAVRSIALDARSAALFYSNVRLKQSAGALHMATGIRTPVGQFWSLSIEEQFYFVWPTLLLLVCAIVRATHRRVALATVLTIVVAASATLSVVWTHTDRNAAYFSSFTRAGELALGALVAVAVPLLGRVRPSVGTVLSWVGLVVVLAGGWLITDQHRYPGALVLIPIAATALVIAGGTSAGRHGATLVLSSRGMIALGAISYSLYLWHFPLITLTEDRLGHVPSVGWRLVVLAAAVLVSIASYRGLEDPIRRNATLARHRTATLAMGACLVAATVATAYAVSAAAG